MTGAVSIPDTGGGVMHRLAAMFRVAASGAALGVMALIAATLLSAAGLTGTPVAAMWPTFGPWAVLLSVTCLVLVLVLRPVPGPQALALSATFAAAAGSVFIMARIVAAIMVAGGSIAPQAGFSLSAIGAGTPDRRETMTTPDGARLTQSIYVPAQGYRTPTPILVYVHGGGWTGGGPDGSAHDLRWFADHGWLVVSLDYRLASTAQPTWDKAGGDVACGLAWTVRNAARFGGDPARIAMLGNSAGGTLALSAAYAAAGAAPSACAPPPVGAVVAGSAVLDLAYTFENGRPAAGSAPKTFIAQYLGGPPAQHPDRVTAVSPAHYLSKHAPPTLLIVPGHDTLVPAAGDDGFVTAARAAGVRLTRVDIPFAGHTFYHGGAGSIGNYGYLTIVRSYLAARNLAPH